MLKLDLPKSTRYAHGILVDARKTVNAPQQREEAKIKVRNEKKGRLDSNDRRAIALVALAGKVLLLENRHIPLKQLLRSRGNHP